jgi:hypothetical protein
MQAELVDVGVIDAILEYLNGDATTRTQISCMLMDSRLRED